MIKREGLYCILLIDDDDATNFIHETIIKMADVDTHIEICNSARMALDYLSNKGEYAANTDYPQPGIIFLDINMPAMDGWAFLNEFRNFPEAARLKTSIYLFSTSDHPTDKAKKELYPEVLDFLAKPLSEEVANSLKEKYFRPRIAA